MDSHEFFTHFGFGATIVSLDHCAFDLNEFSKWHAQQADDRNLSTQIAGFNLS